MTELKILWTYVQAQRESARHDERGVGAVAWIMIVVASVAMALVAIQAVRSFFNEEKSKLGNT